MSVMKKCRLCETSGRHNLDILDGNQTVPPFALRERIFTCVGIQVQRVGGVSTKICQQCYDKVTDFYEFRQICMEFGNTLRSSCRAKEIKMSALKLCRLCGTWGSRGYLNIFESSDLRGKIFECVGVRVHAGELTTEICPKCHHKINDFHEFRQKCIEVGKSHGVKAVIATRSSSIDVEADTADSTDLPCTNSSPTPNVCVDAAPNASDQVDSNNAGTDDHSDDDANSAFGQANSSDSDTPGSVVTVDINDDTDTDANSTEIEPDLNLSVDDNIIPPPPNEVEIDENQDEARNVVQAVVLAVDRPVDDTGVPGISNRKLRSSKIRIARPSQQRNNMNAAPTGRKRFKCSYSNCTKSYAFKKGLKTHMGAIHSGKTFDCTFCSKKFKSQSSITRHMANKHGQGIRYCCYLCHALRYSKENLKQHMNSRHTGQSLFHCSLCGRGFGANSSLRLHMKTHRC